MNNVVVFGLDFDAVSIACAKLSQKLNLKYVNISDVFSKKLLSTINQPTILVDDYLHDKEDLLTLQLSAKDNIIIAMPDDMFLSNQHYKNFKNSLKILILSNKNNAVLNNIENLLIAKADIVLEKDFNLEETIIKIKEKL